MHHSALAVAVLAWEEAPVVRTTPVPDAIRVLMYHYDLVVCKAEA